MSRLGLREQSMVHMSKWERGSGLVIRSENRLFTLTSFEQLDGSISRDRSSPLSPLICFLSGTVFPFYFADLEPARPDRIPFLSSYHKVSITFVLGCRWVCRLGDGFGASRLLIRVLWVSWSTRRLALSLS